MAMHYPLPLPDESADVISIAFGIRNVADPAAAISEFHRVLRPGGRLIILEFSLPTNAILRGLYNFCVISSRNLFHIAPPSGS